MAQLCAILARLPVVVRLSGDFGLNASAESRDDIYQGVERELVDLTTHKFVNARLRNTTMLGGLGLRRALLADKVLDLRQQVGARRNHAPIRIVS